MQNEIIDKKAAEHYFWGENCDSWILVDNDDLSIKEESMPGGTTERLHFHTLSQQFFYILKGTASFYINNSKKIIDEHKGIMVKPNSNHYIANETDERLDFLVVSQPTTNNDRTLIEK